MKIDYVVIHCSATNNPEQWSFEAVHWLHTADPSNKVTWGNHHTACRGWKNIGYHYYIQRDGSVVPGRMEHEIGAHVFGFNNKSLGICLAGDSDFTVQQFTSLPALVRLLRTRHDFELVGHHNLDSSKPCPNFNVKKVLMNV